MTRRLLALAAMLLAAACGETSTVSPLESAPSGARGDTTRTPGTPATPAPPTPTATVFDLAVHVGVATPGPDTLQSTPASNARVAVLQQTFARAAGTGGDTLVVTETVVASGTTDAQGNASFPGLAPAVYRIDAGVGGQSASVGISPPYASQVAVTLVIRGAP